MRRRGSNPLARLLVAVLLAGLGYGAWRTGDRLWVSDAVGTAPTPVSVPEQVLEATGPLQLLRLIEDINGDSRPDAVAVSMLQSGERRIALLLADGPVYRLAGVMQRLQWAEYLPEIALEHLPAAGRALVATVRLPGGEAQVQAFQLDGAAGLQPLDYYRLVAPVRSDRNLVLVDKRLNVLYFYRSGSVALVARVATGKDRTGVPAVKNNFTPEGQFRISVVQVNPSYTSSDGSRTWKGGAPDNPLGTRWMGFSVLPGDRGWIFGIHGTHEPEKIGTWASNGSIWMTNADAERLAEFIGEGTPVEIR